MSKAFEPGDLAITLVPDTDIEQGSQVQLVEPIPAGTVLWYTDTLGVRTPFVTPGPGWRVSHHSHPDSVAYAVCELMPLRGDDLPAETLDTAAPRELVSA